MDEVFYTDELEMTEEEFELMLEKSYGFLDYDETSSAYYQVIK